MGNQAYHWSEGVVRKAFGESHLGGAYMGGYVTASGATSNMV